MQYWNEKVDDESQNSGTNLNQSHEERKQSALRLLSPVLPSFAKLLQKKRIKRKDGNEAEEFTINLNKMPSLIKNKNLTNEDKKYLKENQLKYQMMQYLPAEEDDADDQAKSIDTLSDDDQTKYSQPGSHKEKLAVSPFDKEESNKNLLLSIIKRANSGKEDEVLQSQDKMVEKKMKTKITIKEMMDGLKKKQWIYMKHLIAFLNHKAPFQYLQFPGFYDELAKVLVKMNEESVDGICEVYKLTTIWPHSAYPGQYATFSRFKQDTDEHIFQHGVGSSIIDRYNPEFDSIKKWMRMEPEGEYVNESHFASFQVPLNVSYGSKESIDFLKSLEKCKNNDVFKLPVIQGFLNYKWDQSKNFLLAQAVLHICLLVAFSVYATRVELRDNFILMIVILFFCGIFTVREILQVMGRHCSYLSDPFNYPDMGMIACCVLSVLYTNAVTDTTTITIQWPIVLGILLLYTRAISYFRLWGRTRHLIRSITETFYDMIPFVLIMIVLVVAYATLYVASVEDEASKSLHYGIRIFKGFELMLGAYEDPENDRQYFVLTVMSIVTLIVLLNMLIAIMGDTFGRVQSNTIVYDYRERLSVNIDLESLIYICRKNKRTLFHIGIQRRPGGFDFEEESFSEQNKLLRRLIKVNTAKLELQQNEIAEIKQLLQGKRK